MMSMNMTEFQEMSVNLVQKIDAKRDVEHGVDTTMIHIVEEFGEIAREIYTERAHRGKMNKANLEGEFADVFMLLAHLADLHGVDIESAVQSKVAELRDRFGVDL